MSIIRYITFILFSFYAISLNAQNYSGLWCARDGMEPEIAEYEFINIKQSPDRSLSVELCYHNQIYDFISSKPYTVKGKAYKVCKLFLIKKNGKSIPYNMRRGCLLLLYNNLMRTNRIDFINNSNKIAPHSILNMYNSDISTQLALADLKMETPFDPEVRKVVIERIKDFFDATANGNVGRLKQLVTSEFYRQYYPYSDDKVKEILLSVPYKRRKNMVTSFLNDMDVVTIANKAGDVVTVVLTNRINNKMMTIQLGDEYGTGDWRIFDYDY